MVVSDAEGWEGLSVAVACVPEALRFAEQAHTASVWGDRLMYVGLASLLTSVGLFAADVADDFSTKNRRISIGSAAAGISLVSAGLIFGRKVTGQCLRRGQ